MQSGNKYLISQKFGKLENISVRLYKHFFVIFLEDKLHKILYECLNINNEILFKYINVCIQVMKCYLNV